MADHLVTRLERHGRETPDRTALVFVEAASDGWSEQPLSFGDLDRAARSVASWLRERCAVGERVMLLYGAGPEFVTALAGCLYAGVVAVPAPQPSTQRGHSSRVDGIVRDADIRLVLTDSANHGTAVAMLEQAGVTELPCVATDLLDLAPAPDWQVPPTADDDLVFIQYTSGSTSAPKGVMVTQRSLRHNIGLIARAFALEYDSRGACWLPQHHDMGLIGALIAPLYVGALGYQLAPMAFLRRPHLWLELISSRRATHTSAPNFAYDLCARRVTDAQLAGLDLGSLVSAGNGAEPVSAATLRRFVERFAPAGFRLDQFNPCYGMAETTLLVSGTPRGETPALTAVDAEALAANELRPVAPGGDGPLLVSSGTVHDLDVRIVDPATAATLPDGGIGEIWVRGDSVAAGYWRNPEATAATFRAVTAEGAAGYLRTGDTGALHQGRLYVTGRIKEVLIVNGRNLYPHDIERELAELDEAFNGLSGSVCTVPGTGEQIVVMHEVRRRPGAPEELAEFARRLRGRLAERVGVRIPNLVLLRPGQVRKTTSGKVQRSLMRELFMTGALEPVVEDLDPATAARYRSAAGAR
ncbi:fatty acyl-AMP ligase [Kitasatospora sp. NPDC059973]|uniref:fatty acyl-AMP ligase n=1 Tax=Kitasatospora sp. NPDC059973 TaxID=3347020 RepID=UPI00367F8FB9